MDLKLVIICSCGGHLGWSNVVFLVGGTIAIFQTSECCYNLTIPPVPDVVDNNTYD